MAATAVQSHYLCKHASNAPGPHDPDLTVAAPHASSTHLLIVCQNPIYRNIQLSCGPCVVLRSPIFSAALRRRSALAAVASRPSMQPTAAAEDFYPRRWCRHSPSALSPSIHTADQHQQQLKAVRSTPRLIPSSPLPQMDVCVLHILCCRSYQHLLRHPSIQLSFDQKWDHLKSSFNQE